MTKEMWFTTERASFPLVKTDFVDCGKHKLLLVEIAAFPPMETLVITLRKTVLFPPAEPQFMLRKKNIFLKRFFIELLLL